MVTAFSYAFRGTEERMWKSGHSGQQLAARYGLCTRFTVRGSSKRFGTEGTFEKLTENFSRLRAKIVWNYVLAFFLKNTNIKQKINQIDSTVAVDQTAQLVPAVRSLAIGAGPATADR